ncbi:hypothetical protein AVEN_205881-1, partial [Araneus ventricosus]
GGARLGGRKNCLEDDKIIENLMGKERDDEKAGDAEDNTHTTKLRGRKHSYEEMLL